MVRLTMVFLCLLLAAAAAGRYQAEVAVRDSRNEIARLKSERAMELQQIETLRLDIAYLESPNRLAQLAEKLTDLRPLATPQLMTADRFRVAFAADPAAETPPQASPASVAGAPGERLAFATPLAAE